MIYLEDTRDLIAKYGEKDGKGNRTENFGYPLNLMLVESAEIVRGSFEDCLKKLP